MLMANSHTEKKTTCYKSTKVTYSYSFNYKLRH